MTPKSRMSTAKQCKWWVVPADAPDYVKTPISINHNEKLKLTDKKQKMIGKRSYP